MTKKQFEEISALPALLIPVLKFSHFQQVFKNNNKPNCSGNGATPDFGCGLATQSMFVAAHSFGLGARIYGGPVGNIDSNKELFQIPSGYKAVVALRVGNIDKTVDAVSAVSPRKTPE